MNRRCKPNNIRHRKNYFLRGIKVCDEWSTSYETFLSCVGRRPSPQHSLDRKDNDRGYEPGNVRWATPLQQAHNSRAVKLIEFNGKSLPIAAWARELGLNPATLYGRLRVGWPLEKALVAK
jgi:hypothetical protein